MKQEFAQMMIWMNLTMFVTPSILGQNKITVFGTMAYQQAISVGNWPFASAFAIFFILMIGLFALLARLATILIQRSVLRRNQNILDIKGMQS